MKTEKVKKGARLMARWPDTHFYYWSTLIDQVGDKWKIQFDDGTITEVKQSDLHDSLPPDARNVVSRVTRSSPTKPFTRGSPTKPAMGRSPAKQRKRPEEIRKSPARKVRKLFTDEENIRLGAELSDLEENTPASGTADVRPSSPERSASVSKEIEELKHSAAGVHPSSHERSVSVSRERSDVTQNASDIHSSPFKESSSVTRDTRDVTRDASDVHSSPFKKSASVMRETRDVTRDASDVHSSPFKKTASVTRETRDARDASDVHSSPFKKSASVMRETRDVTRDASDVHLSPFKKTASVTRESRDARAATDVRPSPVRRSISITKETEGVPRDIGDVRRSPSRPSISVTIQNENMKGGAADVRPSPSKSSYTVEVEKESVTRSVTRYTESYLDRDLRRRLLREGSIGTADLRSSPLRSDNPLHERQNVTQDVKSYVESYLDRDFRRQQLKKDAIIGSADFRRSPSRGSDMLLNERGKVMSDLRKHTESYLDRDFRTQLGREGSVDLKKYTDSYLDRDFRKQLGRECSVGSSCIQSSPYRRSVSLTKENRYLTSGTTLTSRYSLKDYEKKHLNKYPVEFGGRFGTLLLILLLPLYIMSVCVFNLVPDPTKFGVLFPKRLLLIPPVAFFVMVLLLMQAVLAIVPIGTVASGPLTRIGILSIHCNGIFAFVLTLLLTLSACFFERKVADIVVSVYTEAAISALFLGIMFALILYKRARKLPISYLNPYGSTGYKFYDFWMGRETTPRIGKFNIKLILHRFSIIIAITLNVLIVTKAYFQGEEEELLKSLMISTIMQSLYCLQFLFHEDIYLYSFLAISEGVGYMITVGFMTFPFILTFTTKVILDYRLKASLTEIGIALCAYTVGHLLLESSSRRKTLSVRDQTTSVWKMKVEPKWNPKIHNRAYLGEIITYWAFAMVAGTTYPGVFIIPAAFTVSVLSRALREYSRCAAYQGDEVNIKQ